MTSVNNELEFDRFKAPLYEVIQRHVSMKQRYVEQTQRFS